MCMMVWIYYQNSFFEDTTTRNDQYFSVLRRYKHGDEHHILVEWVPNIKNTTPIFNDNVKIMEKIEPKLQVAILDKMQIVKMLTDAKDGEVFSYQPHNPIDGEPMNPIYLKKINNTIKGTTFFQANNIFSWENWGKISMDDVNFDIVVSLELLNTLHSNIVSDQDITLDKIHHYFSQLVIKTRHTTEAANIVSMIYDVMCCALITLLQLSKINNSLLMDTIRKVKKGEYKDDNVWSKDLFFVKQYFNKLTGRTVKATDKDLLLNTNKESLVYNDQTITQRVAQISTEAIKLNSVQAVTTALLAPLKTEKTVANTMLWLAKTTGITDKIKIFASNVLGIKPKTYNELLPDKEFTVYSSCVSKIPYDKLEKQVGKTNNGIALDLTYEQLMDHPKITCNKKNTRKPLIIYCPNY